MDENAVEQLAEDKQMEYRDIIGGLYGNAIWSQYMRFRQFFSILLFPI